jgi:hypothetical protein
MARTIVWNGTSDEALALLHAVRVHCECRVENRRIVTSCVAHDMIAHDQRAVDGLLFMRRMATRLLTEERGFTPPDQVAQGGALEVPHSP